MFFLIAPVASVMLLDRTEIVVAAPAIRMNFASRRCRWPVSLPTSAGLTIATGGRRRCFPHSECAKGNSILLRGLYLGPIAAAHLGDPSFRLARGILQFRHPRPARLARDRIRRVECQPPHVTSRQWLMGIVTLSGLAAGSVASELAR